jgi:hypothetical protein
VKSRSYEWNLRTQSGAGKGNRTFNAEGEISLIPPAGIFDSCQQFKKSGVDPGNLCSVENIATARMAWQAFQSEVIINLKSDCFPLSQFPIRFSTNAPSKIARESIVT